MGFESDYRRHLKEDGEFFEKEILLERLEVEILENEFSKVFENVGGEILDKLEENYEELNTYSEVGKLVDSIINTELRRLAEKKYEEICSY